MGEDENSILMIGRETRFDFGKIKNKYVFIEILSYSFFCRSAGELLHEVSAGTRHFNIENLRYIIKNVVSSES